jgi:glycine cleavage system H protein
MDGFSYNNIFETKGIEYLIIITFLLLIIPFWIMINRQSGIAHRIKRAIGALTAGILKIPQGLFFSKNHTWTHLEKSGIAKVGLDDFLLHTIGEVKFTDLKKPGDIIYKGDFLARLNQEGKILKIYSPVSGKVIDTNNLLVENPWLLNEDPYGKGWIFKIKPSAWLADTNSYFLGEAAISWSGKEIDRLRDFLAVSVEKYSPGTSALILQDGGEICDKPLSELPCEVWLDFQKSFADQPF